MTSPNRVSFAVAALAVACSAAVAADQRRAPGERPGVAMEVSLKAGGSTLASTEPGTCTHAPKASIYGVMAEMWAARQSSEGRSVQLTLWKPADGSAQLFSLSVNDTQNLTVSTVPQQASGSGTVALAPAGKGGTFTIEAKAKSGETIAGTIRCEAFTAAIAEGGN
jgi:hypothetical protein